MTSCDELKKLIKMQLGDDIITDFDVGYVNGSSTNVINLRCNEDLTEVFKEATKNTKTMLWCDGLKKTQEGGKSCRF